MNLDTESDNAHTRIRTTTLIENSKDAFALKKSDSIKGVVRLMSKAFRDSKGGSPIERFEEISKLLFCKLYDEKYNNNQAFNFDINSNDKLIYNSIKKTFIAVICKFPKVFLNGRNELSNDIKAIANVSRVLKEYNLSVIPEDVKGRLYEEIVKNTFEKNENQQFFTPRIIADFMVNFIKPNIKQILCDPACGTAGFLITTLDYLFKDESSKIKENYSSTNLVGIEIDSRMAWVAKMNLLMHGGHYSSIRQMDSLSSFDKNIPFLKNNSCDIILTNPPFGSDYTEGKELDNFEVGKGKKSRRRGVLFLEKGIALLKKGGRMGIILEESILNSPANRDIRNLVLRDSIVEAVISLPDTAFMPYASVKSSIVFLRKKKNKMEQQEKIFMGNIKNIGFRPNGEPVFSNERDEFGRLKLHSDFPTMLAAWNEVNKTGDEPLKKYYPNIFTTIFSIDDQDNRLDTLFFHPAKEKANKLLLKSKYPIVNLSKIVTVQNKLVVPRVEFPDDKIRFIGLANIMPEHGTYHISEILGEKIKSSVRVFDNGSVIFSKLRPELKKVIYIPKNEEPGYVSSECLVLKTSDGILPEYLTFILRSDLVYGQLIYQTTGIGRPRINITTLLNVKIPLPNIDEQNEIIKLYKASLEKYENLKKQSKIINKQAEELLQKTFTDIQTKLCS